MLCLCYQANGLMVSCPNNNKIFDFESVKKKVQLTEFSEDFDIVDIFQSFL